MTESCRACGKESIGNAHDSLTPGYCGACAGKLESTSQKAAPLESIRAPVLLMQANPRRVVTANRQALTLFGKPLRSIEGHRGGEVFDCVHSFSEAGCGKDNNCEHCKIKHAIMDTFTTGNAHRGISANLDIRKPSGTQTYVVQVSTEKLGDLALVRVDRYSPLKPEEQ